MLTMETLIHILHLEDDPADVKLVQAALAEAGLACRIICVQTRDEFETGLGEGGMDIILADLRLPTYDGMSALRLAHERCPEIPFIFVSGTMGEEAAIEALTQGATDYVLKQNLVRLASALQRALQEARNWREHRQAEEALQRSNEMLREREIFLDMLLNAIPIPIFYKDRDGRYLGCNRGFETFFGATKEQLIGKSVFEITVPELARTYYTKDNELIESGGKQRYASQVKNVQGIARDVIFNKAVFTDSQGAISGLIGTILDITDLKRTEAALRASEARYIDLYDNAPDMYILVNAQDASIEQCNRTLADTLGYAKVEIIGRSVFDIYHPDCLNQAKQTFIEFLEVGEIHDRELQLRKKDGSKLDVSLSVSAVRTGDGAIVSGRSTLRDITERRRNSMINAARLRLMQFAATHSLDELLEETVNEAEKATESLIGFYHFVDDDQQSLTLQNWSTRTKARFCKARGQGLHYSIADAGVWVDCVHQRKPVVHNDYLSLAHRKGLPAGHAEVVRELVVPVLRGGGIKAILGVGNKPVDYSQKDVEAMSLMADLVWEITERKQAEQQVALMSFALNGIHEAAFMIDENAGFQYVNEEASRVLGYSRDELRTMTVPDANPGFSMERWPGHWSDLKKRGALTFEGQLKTKVGRIFPVEINANYFEYEGRSYYLGLVRDITERQQAERERLANLKFFESMDRVNRAIQGAQDLEAMMKDVLDVVLSTFECDRAYLLNPCDPNFPTWTSPMERNKPEYPGIFDLKQEMPMDPQVAEVFRTLLSVDGPVAFGPGTPHALPEDVSKQFSIKCFMAMAIYPKTGSPWQFGIHQCAYARIWTEEEMQLIEAIGRRLADGLSSLLSDRDLRKNEAFLDNVVEHIPNMIFVKDARTLEFVRFNKAGEQLVGYTREELLGKTDHDLFPKEEADFLMAKDRQVLDSKELADIPEETIRNRNNEKRILHTKKIPILDETGAPQYLLGISEDITERKQAEASIRKLSQAIEQSPVSIVITDVAGRIEFVNAQFTQVTGYTYAEALGQNPRILKSGETPAEEYRRLWKTIGSGGVWQGEFHNRKKNGELFWEQATIAPVRDADNVITHYVAVKEDITERKKLEAQFRQVQKLEAIGLLAGGIAHDFNNILSAITGYAEISMFEIEPESPVSEYLAHVLEAGGRAKELINQIMMFSRETEQELRPIRIALPVKEALKLIRASVPVSIEMRSEILSQASALADHTQVHQIMMNLCTNAAHAMRENGGLLHVRLTDITIDAADHRKNYPDTKPGEYIRLTVSDQGHGIDAFNLHRIFDPFFTTKEKGEGTGMGLSVVHGIVKSCGGSIYVHSRIGAGSIFEILIPALESAVQDDIALQKPVPMGSETILFVDDEAMIVDIAKPMLTSLGYRVTVRTSAMEALEAFKNNPDGFDLVITDLTMPKMSGLDLAEKILQIRPGLPIVLCTGFGASMNEEQVVRRGVRGIIFKPILRHDMATVLTNIKKWKATPKKVWITCPSNSATGIDYGLIIKEIFRHCEFVLFFAANILLRPL
jgi:PAS domain S-box-containing protein